MKAWLDKLTETFLTSGYYKLMLEGLGNTVIITLGALVIGVGIGGPLEEVARLATEATARPINIRNADPMVAELEKELLDALNMSQIGPMGMGGDTTALAVNIECSGTHRPWMPVAVNINCWPGRKATCRIYTDGRVEQIIGGASHA